MVHGAKCSSQVEVRHVGEAVTGQSLERHDVVDEEVLDCGAALHEASLFRAYRLQLVYKVVPKSCLTEAL